MKKIYLIAVTIFGVLSILKIMDILFSSETSIAMIGGSDGPTQIFVAGKIENDFIGIIILFVTTLILFWLWKKQK